MFGEFGMASVQYGDDMCFGCLYCSFGWVGPMVAGGIVLYQESCGEGVVYVV